MLFLGGHSGPVQGVAFHPGGRLLASASTDSTVRGWSLPSGAELFRHTTSLSRATRAAFAPRWLGLGGSFRLAGRTRQLVHAGRCRTARSIMGPTGSESRLGVRAQHGIALCGGRVGDRRIAPSRWRSGAARQAEESFEEIVVGPDGHVYALCHHSADVFGMPPDLSRWDVLTTGPLEGSAFHAQFGLSASPDGRRIAFGAGDVLAVWDGRPVRTPRTWSAHHDIISATAFADATTLLTAGGDGVVKAWDVITGTELASYDFGIGELYCLAVAPDRLTAAVGGLNGIVVWDLAD